MNIYSTQHTTFPYLALGHFQQRILRPEIACFCKGVRDFSDDAGSLFASEFSVRLDWICWLEFLHSALTSYVHQ